MKKFYSEFKSLTGYKQVDMAEKFKVSRQYINQLLKNRSLQTNLALYGMTSIMIDLKISELNSKIRDLVDLKEQIEDELYGGELCKQ